MLLPFIFLLIYYVFLRRKAPVRTDGGGWRSSPLLALCSIKKSWIVNKLFHCVATS